MRVMQPARQHLCLPVFLLSLVLATFTGCSHLPIVPERPESRAITDTAMTRLGQVISPQVAAHDGKSGIIGIGSGHDAFAVRALLAEAAESTLDLQYYIWRDDFSGTLLLGMIHRAAERGVRVRLLLDDTNTSPGLDSTLSALDAHPNIEVRLFNPFFQRRARVLGYLTDFSRLNRRMHNKSFTVDGQVTVIGGRNVGDQYFEAYDTTSFVDLDVLAVGPVVREVADDFDRYWASESAYPVSQLLPAATHKTKAAFQASVAKAESSPESRDYRTALQRGPVFRELMAGRLALEWTKVLMVSDDPAKGLGRSEKSTHLSARTHQIIGNPTREFAIVSPYFVPTQAGTARLAGLARQGVQVCVLTNSLEATDVVAVHAGYAKHRRELLRAGVRLFELKRAATPASSPISLKLTAPSASSLHAKTFAVDGTRLFVGSFNFDPRSDHLNTEIGFIIDSPTGAQRLAQALNGPVAENAYQVKLTHDDRLVWIDRNQDTVTTHEQEPGTTLWRRLAVGFCSLLPIEWLL